MPYYSLYIPSNSSGEHQTDADPGTQSSYVFTKKWQALELLKKQKDARLREFSNEDDAIQYSETGYEVITTRYADSKVPTATGEKVIFRAPSKQELIEFRKIIEAGDYERVKSIIWDNPRYLVSSGDTPTTLKEGYRYNAMHVCSISKKPRIAELILQTVSDPKFVELLTGKKNEEKMCKELCANLLNYYLNIPEKGRSETPLHFASKFVCVEMVEVLTSYPEVKMTPNNEGCLPKDIIGSRNAQAAPDDIKKIRSLLEEPFYVPVLRTMDGSVPPQIGQFFSANNPPNLNCDPLSPEVKIQALAGPMNMEQAKEFRRRWKTPPRVGSTASSPIANNPYISPMKPRSVGNTSTPTKIPSLGSCQQHNSSSTTANRVLFQITPMASLSESNDNDGGVAELVEKLEINGEQSVESSITPNENGVDVNGVDHSSEEESIDKQNGNHKGGNDGNAEIFHCKMLTDATTVLDVKMETNNNNHDELSIDAVAARKTGAMLCPSASAIQFKKTAFSTYRDSFAPSPINFGALNNESMLETSDRENLGNTPICRGKGRPLMPSKLLRTPVLQFRRDAFLMAPNEESPQSTTSTLIDGISELQADTTVNVSMAGDRSLCDTPGFKERHVKISDIEKGLEIIGRELAKEQNIEWREYWDFLDCFIDIASPEGLHLLENYFSERVEETEMSKKAAAQITANANYVMLCSALDTLAFAGGDGGSGRNNFNEYARYADGMATAGDSGAGGAATGAGNTATTPYTCVEKSLQVFAKRMTKTIIHNINNMVSINDTLMSELKRLKSLICSFKEDARFLDVNFTKVHSRIGNLVSIYLENSQEPSVKSKIQTIIQNLLTASNERREHIECLCSRIHYTLMHPSEQIQPENLKTEAMCAKVWENEKDCDCQWETNLSRKLSRRNRMESRNKSHISMQHEKNGKNIGDNHRSEAQSPLSAEEIGDDNDDDDDVFWFDFVESETEDEGDDVWKTPPESPSGLSILESGDDEDKSYKTYIYGSEPTKRDLDVLNAIFHVEIDKQKYPNVYAWRETLMRYPNEEMDFFPSPTVVRKSQSFIKMNQTPKSNDVAVTPVVHRRATPHGRVTPAAAGTAGTVLAGALHHSPNRKADNSMSTAKRLFLSGTPRQKSNVNINNNITAAAAAPPISAVAAANQQSTASQSPAAAAAAAHHNQIFMSPLNRLRGLFYRDRSPLSSASSASPVAYIGDRSGSDGSNNLSLLNISAAE